MDIMTFDITAMTVGGVIVAFEYHGPRPSPGDAVLVASGPDEQGVVVVVERILYPSRELGVDKRPTILGQARNPLFGWPTVAARYGFDGNPFEGLPTADGLLARETYFDLAHQLLEAIIDRGADAADPEIRSIGEDLHRIGGEPALGRAFHLAMQEWGGAGFVLHQAWEGLLSSGR